MTLLCPKMSGHLVSPGEAVEFKTLLYIYKYVVQGTGSLIMMVGKILLLDLKI